MVTLSTQMILVLLTVAILVSVLISSLLLILKTIHKKKIVVDLDNIKKAFVVSIVFFVLLVGLFQLVVILDTRFLFGSLRNCTSFSALDRFYDTKNNKWDARHILIEDTSKIKQITDLIIKRKYKLTSIGLLDYKDSMMMLIKSSFNKNRPLFQLSLHENSIIYSDKILGISRKYECSDENILSKIRQVLWADKKE